MFDHELSLTLSLFGIIGAIGAMFLKLWSIAYKYGQLEIKVNTLWEFLMRRSLATGIEHGSLTMNSPIKSTATAEHALQSMANDLGDFYKYTGFKLNERDLFIEIERRFGDRILREVAIPHKIHQGAAVFAAIDVAKKKAKLWNKAS